MISVKDVTATPAVYRDLAMIKVRRRQPSGPASSTWWTCSARAIIDLAPDSLTIEITGAEDKIDGLLEVLRPYGVLEMARTGRVAMARGVKGGRQRGRAASHPTAPPIPAFPYSV